MSLNWTLNHFQSLFVFALVISIVFAFLSKRRIKDRVLYFLWTLMMFLLIGVAIGWAMFPFSR
jgi:cytochrome bd-type quinol oxidase subunit 2